MKFQKEKWIGNWENFENYIYSKENAMVKTWEEAETVCKSMPGMQAMFGGCSARDFWKKACVTRTDENPVMLGGMCVEAYGEGVRILFWDEENNPLGEYIYILAEVLEHGLEGKENVLFLAENAADNCPFRYLLSMEPMPDWTTKEEKDLLSHFHFQFASTKNKLMKDGKLVQPMWYATMCEKTDNEAQKCNVVRALHRIPMEKIKETI